jgi:hypothetical protein
MVQRGPLIAVLLVIELAILGGMVTAFQGGPTMPWSAAPSLADMAPGPHLIEGGPHQAFAVGPRPALNVDIGYADLTILTGGPAQIEVSVSKSEMFGFMRAKGPIAARADGQTVQIVKTEDDGVSMGDDRMVTVVVPPGTRVTVAHAGDIKVTGLRAEASINSVGNGSITVADFNGPGLHITASNGRIVLQEVVAQRLDASSDNGRVEGTALQVRDGDVESSNGNVTLGFAPGADTLVTADTSNGKIRVSGVAVSPAATSRKSGGDDDDDDDDSSSQTVRLGAGGGHLDVHASNGNIHLTQEG